MPDALSWDDAEDIAQMLRERFPETDPQTLSELEIARWAREIPALAGAPGEEFSTQVEAIRDAWRRL
ncbi:MAG TPA: Fe-S cluster assembly protein IscX [Terriglobales bacterium]|nr:Fe-S cluster assembly protein IscX [Terriglobales bacterium]